METPGDYDRLVRFLELASTTGLHLVLARYEHAEVARRARAAAIVAARAAGREVVEVDFSDADDDDDISARLQAANAQAPIVFAFGLEGLLLDLGVEPRATNAIARFNFDRDLLPERMHGVLVLWLSYRAARAFAMFARDTFDVISTSFDFPERLESPGEIGREFVTMDSLPEWATLAPLARVPELEDRARLLESLYADATPGSAGAADLAVSLGKIAASLGDMDGALEWFDRAVQDYVQDGNVGRALNVRLWRTNILVRAGRVDLAEREIDALRAIASSVADVEADLGVKLASAEVEQLRGNHPAALAMLADVVSHASHDALRTRALTQIAEIRFLEGDFDEALRIYTDLDRLYREQGATWSRGRNAMARAAALIKTHELDQAIHLLHSEALPIFQQSGDVEHQARTTLLIAAILAHRGELDQAIALLRDQALLLFVQLNDPGMQANARELLTALLRKREAAGEDLG